MRLSVTCGLMVGVLAAVAVSSNGCGSVCLSSSQCPENQACVGGKCSPVEESDETVDIRPSQTDGGPVDGGDLDGGDGGAGVSSSASQTSSTSRTGSSSSTTSSSRSSSGAADAGGVQERTFTAPPTAIAVGESGTELWVAWRHPSTPPLDRVERFSLPLPGSTSSPINLAPNNAGDCSPTTLIHRGTFLYAGCSGNSTVVRVLRTNGTQEGTDQPLAQSIVGVDHLNMLAFAGATGGTLTAVYLNPAQTPAYHAGPGSGGEYIHYGLGLIENTANVITHAVIATGAGAALDVVPHTGSGVFGPPVQQVASLELLRIASGRRISGGIQPVLVLETDGTLHVWDGPALAATEGGPEAKLVDSVGLSDSQGLQDRARLKMKVRGDGKYVYLVSSEQKVCRVNLEPSGPTTAECRDLLGCDPVDVAPTQGGSATFVACSGSRKVVGLQGF